MERLWIDAVLHFKPSGETEYQINRSVDLFTTEVRDAFELRIHTDDASKNPETKLPHYQVVATFEDSDNLRDLGERLIKAADELEEQNRN